MLKRRLLTAALVGSLGMVPLTGCENLPGDEKTQGAVLGGLGGAAAGVALSDNDLLGALLGGALGAGGGYLIGSQIEKADEDNRDEAIRASERARTDPASIEDVRESRTADLNDDGFVTLDEVVAMERAGLGDREILERLDRTNQFYDLNASQRAYLRERGVSDYVIDRMANINPELRERAMQRINR